jgi:hypothetical protein
MPRPLLALIAIAAALLVPSVASAQKINIAVGIGDQSEQIFDDEKFQALKVKKVRYFIKWDAVDRPGELAQADAFVNRAKLPSVATYRRKVKQLIDRYRPQGVRTWGGMNEANHDSQPTWNNPKRAAQFFLAMRSMCRGCTIVALDVLDQRGVERYIRRFYSALGSRKSLAKIVGIHNYSDTNRNRDTGTRMILKAVKAQNPRAQFWLTETGGVAKFGTSFPCDPDNPARAERRQAKAINFMFTLTKRFRRDLRRLYIYNYNGADCEERFDAGLVRRDGTPRPAYDAVKRQLKNFKR